MSWAKRKKDKRFGSFVALPRRTLRSEAWRELSTAAKLFYIHLKGKYNGHNNEIIESVLAKEELSEALIKFKDSVKETTGANCDYCGIEINRSQRPFLSSFTRVLIMRFLELLRSKNRTDYISGILDCIHAVFGTENPVMIKALDNEDLLDPFLKKFLDEERLNK